MPRGQAFQEGLRRQSASFCHLGSSMLHRKLLVQEPFPCPPTILKCVFLSFRYDSTLSFIDLSDVLIIDVYIYGCVWVKSLADSQPSLPFNSLVSDCCYPCLGCVSLHLRIVSHAPNFSTSRYPELFYSKTDFVLGSQHGSQHGCFQFISPFDYIFYQVWKSMFIFASISKCLANSL